VTLRENRVLPDRPAFNRGSAPSPTVGISYIRSDDFGRARIRSADGGLERVTTRRAMAAVWPLRREPLITFPRSYMIRSLSPNGLNLIYQAWCGRCIPFRPLRCSRSDRKHQRDSRVYRELQPSLLLKVLMRLFIHVANAIDIAVVETAVPAAHLAAIEGWLALGRFLFARKNSILSAYAREPVSVLYVHLAFPTSSFLNTLGAPFFTRFATPALFTPRLTRPSPAHPAVHMRRSEANSYALRVLRILRVCCV
jgi:hypothetical protein